MLWAHAMLDAIEPILHAVEDEADDRHELSGHLGAPHDAAPAIEQ